MERNPFVQSGGHYRPPHCFARCKSAILVAYRNQEKCLRHLLYYIHPFLQRQQLSYTIYLIQQVNTSQMCLLGSSAARIKGWVLSKKCDSSDVEILFYAWAQRRSDMAVPSPCQLKIEIPYHFSRSRSCCSSFLLCLFFLGV